MQHSENGQKSVDYTFSTQLREHSYSLHFSPSGNLAAHCSRCGCVSSLHLTKILGRGKEQTERDIAKALFIAKKGGRVACERALSRHEVAYRSMHPCGEEFVSTCFRMCWLLRDGPSFKGRTCHMIVST